MAKKESKETYQDTKKSQDEANKRYEDARSKAAGESSEAKDRAAGSRDDLLSSAGGIGEKSAQWDDFVRTGGYSPERERSIMENVSGLKELGRTGGIDQESQNRFRGLGVFDEFSNTGGYSDRDRSNIRSRALAPISSYATSTQNELDRRRKVQGGYAPGFDASSRALRRDTGRLLSDTSRDAELDIMDRVNEGRRWGSSNVSSSEGNLQTLRTGNMFRGLTSAADIEMSLQNSINQYKAMGMSAQDAAARAIADIYGNVASMDNSNRENALNREAGLLGDQTNADLGYLNARNNANRSTGTADKIMSGLGTGLGWLGKILPGGGKSSAPDYNTLGSDRVAGSEDINSGLYNLPGRVGPSSDYENPGDVYRAGNNTRGIVAPRYGDPNRTMPYYF